jgi:hypothetical protein
MEQITECVLITVAGNDEICFKAAEDMLVRATRVHDYWLNKKTNLTAGAKLDSANASWENAEWVMLGARQGMFKLFPDRYDANGLRA